MSSEAFYMSQVEIFSLFCSFLSLILSPDTFRTYLTNDFGNPDTGKFTKFCFELDLRKLSLAERDTTFIIKVSEFYKRVVEEKLQ